MKNWGQPTNTLRSKHDQSRLEELKGLLEEEYNWCIKNHENDQFKKGFTAGIGQALEFINRLEMLPPRNPSMP